MTERRRIALLYGGGVLLMALFCLTPILYMVVTAANAQYDYLASGVEPSLTWDHFSAVVFSPNLHFMRYLANSFIVSLASAGVCILLAAPAAYGLTRLRLPGRLTVLFAILAVSMFPQISLVSTLYRMMDGLGWINTYQGLVLPYTAWILPLSLWILTSYFAQVPQELDRAGLMDGCTRLQVLRKIILPVAAPGIFSTSLLAFIFAFNEFMFALMLTTDHTARTVPVGIALFQGLHGETPWGEIMAAAAITTVPLIALTIVFQRRIIQGLTRGAVKG